MIMMVAAWHCLYNLYWGIFFETDNFDGFYVFFIWMYVKLMIKNC